MEDRRGGGSEDRSTGDGISHPLGCISGHIFSKPRGEHTENESGTYIIGFGHMCLVKDLVKTPFQKGCIARRLHSLRCIQQNSLEKSPARGCVILSPV